jgi:hypothetical protein
VACPSSASPCWVPNQQDGGYMFLPQCNSLNSTALQTGRPQNCDVEISASLSASHSDIRHVILNPSRRICSYHLPHWLDSPAWIPASSIRPYLVPESLNSSLLQVCIFWSALPSPSHFRSSNSRFPFKHYLKNSPNSIGSLWFRQSHQSFNMSTPPFLFSFTHYMFQVRYTIRCF